MNFNSYIADCGRSVREIAVQLDVSTSYISYLRTGRRYPSMKLVARISEVTGGVVTFNDWLQARETNPQPWSNE